MAVEKLFTVAGITVHRGATHTGIVSERTKVRWGTDTIRLIKMLNSDKKVWDRRLDIGLAPVRVDLVDLPVAMTKLAALQHLAQHPDFQSPGDQYLIRDEIADRTKAAKRGEVKFAGAVVTAVAKETAKA